VEGGAVPLCCHLRGHLAVCIIRPRLRLDLSYASQA
jgi:hypothetical protein